MVCEGEKSLNQEKLRHIKTEYQSYIENSFRELYILVVEDSSIPHQLKRRLKRLLVRYFKIENPFQQMELVSRISTKLTFLLSHFLSEESGLLIRVRALDLAILEYYLFTSDRNLVE
jgi:hypothetical protein